MKTSGISIAFLMTLSVVLLSSCTAIEGIFKAGVWSGIIFVALIIGVIIFIITRLGKRS